MAGRLDHARAVTTLNVYSHFVDACDQAAAATMGQILGNNGSVDGQPEPGQRRGRVLRPDLIRDSVERTTRFEPATLTLAR